MKIPKRYEGPLGHSDSGVDHYALERTIFDWRDGGKCVFTALALGKDVPAKRVAAYARATADSVHETSRLAHEKPKLVAVAEYADKLAKFEEITAAFVKAAKLARCAEIDWSNFNGEFQRVAAAEWDR